MKTIIVPMLNITSKDQLPLEFQVNQTNGLMNCIYSLININLTSFTEIIFGILKEHEDKYSIVDHIKADIKRNDIKDLFNALEISYYIFDKPTSSQSETIYTIIISKRGLFASACPLIKTVNLESRNIVQ